MEVRFALLADSANLSREGKLNITGAFDRINAQGYPAVHLGACLVLGIEAHPGEVGRHEIRIVFADADGNSVIEVNLGLVIDEPGDKSRPVRGNQIVPVKVMPLPHAGDYSFDIFIDGRYEASVPVTALTVEG